METSIRESEYVLLICTSSFAEKANAGEGGVGYETTIVTGEIYEKIASPRKFVPVLRKGNKTESLPSYLKSKALIDFRDDDKFDEKLEELLRHLNQSPKYDKPPLGPKPDFFSREVAQPMTTLKPTSSVFMSTEKENRKEFLCYLFKLSGGNENQIVSMWKIGEDLGLSREETARIYQYISGEYLLEARSSGGGISITHAGVVKAEEICL